MVEPEMAFYELQDNMALAEAFIKRIIPMRWTLRRGHAVLPGAHRQGPARRLENYSKSDFLRVPYTEAINILQKSGQTFEFPVHGASTCSRSTNVSTEKHFKQPVILYDYPRTLKPFYMRVNDDGKTVRAMDVLVPGVGEIIGGSQREERLDVLEQRMQRARSPSEGVRVVSRTAAIWDGAAFRFRLRVERTHAVSERHGQIRDVIPFPRTPGSAEF